MTTPVSVGSVLFAGVSGIHETILPQIVVLIRLHDAMTTYLP